MDAEGGLSMTNMLDDHINIHGTEVQNAWGFVMNYLGKHDVCLLLIFCIYLYLTLNYRLGGDEEALKDGRTIQ